MKKILSILSAGLVALAAISCVNEDLATVDVSNATAPVLSSYEVGEDAILAFYTPGEFKMDFNQKMPVYHSLILASVNGTQVGKALTATDQEGNGGRSFKLTKANLAKAIAALGYPEGSVVSVDMFILSSSVSFAFAFSSSYFFCNSLVSVTATAFALSRACLNNIESIAEFI